MLKDLAAFLNDPAVFRKAVVGLLGLAGTVGLGCSAQLSAAFPGHQAGIVAACAVAVALAGLQMHNSGETK